MILNHVLENSSSRNAPDDQGSTKKFTNNCQSKLPGEGTARKITPETMDCSVPRRLRLCRRLVHLNRDVRKWLEFLLCFVYTYLQDWQGLFKKWTEHSIKLQNNYQISLGYGGPKLLGLTKDIIHIHCKYRKFLKCLVGAPVAISELVSTIDNSKQRREQQMYVQQCLP